MTRITHMRVGARLYPIDSLAEASRMSRAALARWPGRFTDIQYLALVTADGVEVGCVSANGRCWIGHPRAGEPVCVYIPDDG